MNRHDIAQKTSSVITRLTTTAMVCALLGLGAGAATAGSLTPPGPPAPTMRTLDQQKPTWDKIIPTAQRFVDALDGTATLDKETGLVWQKTPSQTMVTWDEANSGCANTKTGGRYGWRLPAVHELLSLMEPSGNIMLLPANVFSLPTQIMFWTTSPYLSALDSYYTAFLHYWSGPVDNGALTMGGSQKSSKFNFWCVRGGQ
jgi:hypothetical protein